MKSMNFIARCKLQKFYGCQCKFFFWDPTRDEQQQLIISSLESCRLAQKKCPSTEHMQITVVQHWSETDTQAGCERKAYNAIHPPAMHTKEWEPRKPCPSAIHQVVHNGLISWITHEEDSATLAETVQSVFWISLFVGRKYLHICIHCGNQGGLFYHFLLQ